MSPAIWAHEHLLYSFDFVVAGNTVVASLRMYTLSAVLACSSSRRGQKKSKAVLSFFSAEVRISIHPLVALSFSLLNKCFSQPLFLTCSLPITHSVMVPTKKRQTCRVRDHRLARQTMRASQQETGDDDEDEDDDGIRWVWQYCM